MAATVLNSPRAIEMSVYVVRAFVKSREVLSSNRLRLPCVLVGRLGLLLFSMTTPETPVASVEPLRTTAAETHSDAEFLVLSCT
jgi:hypothetical protein